MDYAERQKKIVEYLRIKSTSHGQIYTFQIAVPPSASVEISPERFEAISHSLTQQGTNLIPLIVRRTEAYSEEEEYEVIDGVDWYLVAKEIGIEKLWVWVFDMTDEEAQIARQEMELLVGKSEATVPDSVKQIELLLKRFEASVDRKLEDKLNEQLSSIVGKLELGFQQFEEFTDSRLENKLDELFSKVEKIEAAIATRQKSIGSACLKDNLKSIAKAQSVKILSKYTKAQIIDAIEEAKNIKILPEWSKTQIVDAIEKACE